MIDWLQVFSKADHVKSFRTTFKAGFWYERDQIKDTAYRQLKVGSLVVDIVANITSSQFTLAKKHQIKNDSSLHYAHISFTGKYEGTRRKFVTQMFMPIPLNIIAMINIGEGWYSFPEFNPSFVTKSNYTDNELTLLRLAL